MSWCLDCHRNPGPNRRPVSEVTNMKWTPPGTFGCSRRSSANDRSIRRLTVRGATGEPRYWRSLAQIEDLPEYRAALEREFPEGASELPDGITRRDMMMLVGASLSLAGLAGCRRPVEEIVLYVAVPRRSSRIPRYYATTMPFRRSAYGLIVESHEGRPTKIEGNPRTPRRSGPRARACRRRCSASTILTARSRSR